MQAIAEKAGVSTTTVSLALRDHASISEETKKRIQEIQHSMGYQFTGRRVKSRQPYRPNLEQIIYRTVGVDMREENYAPFLAGVVDECRQLGIKLELDNVPIAHFSEVDSVSPGMVPKRGIIISGRITDRDLDEVEQSGLPYVVLGNNFLDRPTHMVGVNVSELARRMMKDLVSKGMKRTVFFVEIQDRPIDSEFLRCMRSALAEFGVPLEKTAVVEGGLNFQNMEAAVELIGKQVKQGARIVTIEKHCAEALSLAWRNSSRRGEDIDVTSFVGTPPRFPIPGFKPFDLGLELCGRLAVARLTELQRNPSLPFSRSFIYSPGWV